MCKINKPLFLFALVVFIFLFGIAVLADTEPTNNTRQRAEIIQPGTYSGTIGGKDEEDWYEFSVKGGDVIHVKLEPNSADDVKVELHNHEDSLLEDCKPGKPLTYVTAAELGQRNWYLFVSAHKGGSYRFTLEVVPQNDAGTGKDAPAAFHKALPISGGVIKGMLGNDDEEDYFKFTASPGQTIVIEFKADFSRFDKTMDSIKLDLLAPYESGLESVRSYGSKEVLTYGPLPENEAGEMRISVTGEGDYEFSIPLLGAGEPTLEKASPQAEQPAEETKDTAAGQTVNFGGSGQLKFFFSVKGEGAIKAQVQWNPQTQANIMLFSPGKKLPVAETKGTGSASLSYTVKAESGISGQLGKVVEAIESLKGADTNQWLLLITPQPPETVIQGQVTLEFPGSDSSRLEWRPFVPATDIGKAALSSYLNSVDRLTSGQAPGNESEKRLQDRMSKDSQFAANIKNDAEAFRAMPQADRSNVIGVASSGSASDIGGLLQAGKIKISDALVQAQQALDVDLRPSEPPDGLKVEERPAPTIRPEDLQLSSAHLTIRFNCIFCKREMRWDGGSDSDEIYYMIGLVGPDKKATGFMSGVFGDFDSGERRPPTGIIAHDIVWERDIKGDTYCVLVLMEHDYSNRDGVFKRFLNCLEDTYSDINNLTGISEKEGAAVGAASGAVAGAALGPVGAAIGAAFGALFGWIVSGLGDDMIGQPAVLYINPSLAAAWERGPGFIWNRAFKGGGADYGLWFNLGKE